MRTPHNLRIFQTNHYPEILRVCLPLVLSLSATTLMEFTDRIFLANYSIDAISAALPAGITSYLFLAFFGGVGGYVGVFIAQYCGRGDSKKIGAVLWQGIYFTIFSGLFIVLIALVASEFIFAVAGHPPEVQILERKYFDILCYGSVLHIGMTTLSTFFTGRGITRPVMVITFIGVAINIPLDFAMIFGKWGLPELGIEGAGVATVVSWGVNVLLLCLLIFTRKNNHKYGVFSSRNLNKDIFLRLMRYGIPGALQFTMDILAFTLFILLVGRIGKVELAATNIVLSINALAFMPSMGASQGMSILVGQALGRGKPLLATEFVRGGWQLLIGYILAIDLLFLFAPEIILTPFLAADAGGANTSSLLHHSVILLKIVSAYLFFDALYMIFSGALRGAGDTRFMMLGVAITAPLFFILPVAIGIEYFGMGIAASWIWVLVFITILFALSVYRYSRGAWKKMLVIEDKPIQGE